MNVLISKMLFFSDIIVCNRNNNLMPLWYTFACTKESAGDAIDMANAFYGSGLCIYAEPDIMLTIIIDDSEPEPI